MKSRLVLDDEQGILKNAAHEYFAAQMPVSALRTLRDNHDESGFDRDAWAMMAEMGWAGVLVPEAHGGSAFGYVGLGQVLEESGRTLAATPLLSTALVGATALTRAGNVAQQEALLPAMAEGRCLLALALEEGPRHDPQRIDTVALRTKDGFNLSGEKCFVIDGHIADQLIVVARLDSNTGAYGLFLVPATATGVSVRRLDMVDARNMANISLRDVAVGADALMDGAPSAAAIDHILDAARAGMAAEMLGNGLEAFERTLKYLRLREQFGVSIGSFQALKHRAALMFCELELTRSAVLAALIALDEDSDDVPSLASLAKAKACDMLELISNEAVQMHGGIGMTDEEEIGLFLKRARVAQQCFGDATFHRDRYATLAGF